MEKIIKAAVERGASDLHIKAGDVFRARIDGRLVPLTKQALTPDQTKAIALRLIPNEDDRKKIDRITDYDCSWGMAGVGRFRVNILRQRSSFMIVMRVIPFTVPTIESLRLPDALKQVADLNARWQDTEDAYLRLHLLSHRLVKPHEINLDGIFGVLPNVAWTSAGPVDPAAALLQALEHDRPALVLHELRIGRGLLDDGAARREMASFPSR